MSADNVTDGLISARDVLRNSLGVGALSSEAMATYEFALQHPTAEVPQIAQAVGVQDEELAPLVDELLGLGLLSVDGDGSVHPRSPRVALLGLIDRQEEELRDKQQQLRAGRRSVEEFIEDFERSRPTRDEVVEVLTNRQDLLNRISEMLVSTTNESMSMLTTEQAPEALRSAREVDLDQLSRGIKVRTLVLAGHMRRSRELVDYEVEMVEAGAEVRVAPTLPTRLSVWDRSVALLPIDPGQPKRGACLVSMPGLVDVLVQTFERYWSTAQPLSVYLASISGGSLEEKSSWTPSPLEHEILRLLAAGHKDESLARRVGMSLRSVRRVIAKISEELDTASRFQMGVRATERGII